MTGAQDAPPVGPAEAPPVEPAEAPAVVCATCGTTASADARVALTWSRSVERGRTAWTCPDCARRHVRAIEGRLDSEWW